MSSIPRRQYPGAVRKMDGGRNRDGLGFGPYTAGTQPVGVVLHTTETTGVPGYQRTQPDGSVISVAPHFTLDLPRLQVVQHVETDLRAGTLVGSSTLEGGKQVPTNAGRVLQLELVCYSARNIADAHPARTWVGELPDPQLRLIAEVLLWAHRQFGTPLAWWPKARPSGSQPMSHAAWWHDRQAFGWGICEHATAPDNSPHWDCGAIEAGRIMELVRTLAGGPTGQEEEQAMLRAVRDHWTLDDLVVFSQRGYFRGDKTPTKRDGLLYPFDALYWWDILQQERAGLPTAEPVKNIDAMTVEVLAKAGARSARITL